MKTVHECTLKNEYRPLTVALIGCGGNGSAVLFGLPYLHQALLAWGRHGIRAYVCDQDTVSPTNCVRQPFGAADIGSNKATVLVNRVNLFHGLDWIAVPKRFSRNESITNSMFDETVDLVISCVDTKSARAEMHDAFFRSPSRWQRVKYWLDLGNNADNGQFVLGQPLNAANVRSRTRLRCVTELFPAIMDTRNGEDDLPSCSAAEALTRQEPFINNVLASSALAMVTRLLRYGTIDHHGAFYNAATARSAPMPIDPEAWAKLARRNRRLFGRAA